MKIDLNKYILDDPNFIQLEPTVQCNSNCQMCERTITGRTKGDLGYGNFLKIMENFVSLKEILLQGVGEPLLNKDFFKMVRYCKSKNMYVVTNTNASLINEKIAQEIIDSGIDEVRFSIDATSAKIFENIRQGLKFDAVKSNILRLSKLIKKQNSHKPTLSFSVTGMLYNLNELPNIVEFGFEANIEHIQLLNLYPLGKGMAVKENSYKYGNKEKIHQLLNAAARKCNIYGISFIAPYLDKEEAKEKVLNCSWPWSKCNISFEGLVTPCCVVSNPNDFNFGNILEVPFKMIWNSDKYNEFRNHFLKGKIPSPCELCFDSSFILRQY